MGGPPSKWVPHGSVVDACGGVRNLRDGSAQGRDRHWGRSPAQWIFRQLPVQPPPRSASHDSNSATLARADAGGGGPTAAGGETTRSEYLLECAGRPIRGDSDGGRATHFMRPPPARQFHAMLGRAGWAAPKRWASRGG